MGSTDRQPPKKPYGKCAKTVLEKGKRMRFSGIGKKSKAMANGIGKAASRLLSGIASIVCFKIPYWDVGMSGWDESDIQVIVQCRFETWYWTLTEWFWWNVQAAFCESLHHVPLPSLLTKWKRHWDDWDDEPTTLGEYYGNDLGCLWDALICGNGFQVIWKHLDQNPMTFVMPLPEAREKFKYHPEKFHWIEKEMERRKEAR